MTAHTSQGSTFGSVFVDVADIRSRERHNLLEMQQVLYVAVTRATTSVMLLGSNLHPNAVTAAHRLARNHLPAPVKLCHPPKPFSGAENRRTRGRVLGDPYS